ncbi:hypothetical protein LT493_08885 [Streptomyces tricolor]|nr:hypothetical protein [Streptomyces tricolor]
MYAWGANSGGQLGYSPLTDRYAPAAVSPLPKEDVQEISAGGGIDDGWGFTVALRKDYSVWTWGENDKGQLGTGPGDSTTNIPAPGKVPGLNGIVDVAAGGQHALALRTNTGKGDGGLRLGAATATGRSATARTPTARSPSWSRACTAADRSRPAATTACSSPRTRR